MGSEIYVIGGYINDRVTSTVLILDARSRAWRRLPSMRTAHQLPVVGAVDGKIYVIGGGCNEWFRFRFSGEMFDPKTQTWEHLPYPHLSFDDQSLYCSRHSAVMDGKVYGMLGWKCFSYDPRDGKWEAVADPNLNSFRSSCCVIENVLYSCDLSGVLLWHDSKGMKWREVKGVGALPRFPPMAKLANYGGNLAVVWEERRADDPMTSEILCTEIALVRRSKGEIWGRVKWSDVVHTFPNSHYRPDILHCVAATI